jgi:hypothetical protein
MLQVPFQSKTKDLIKQTVHQTQIHRDMLKKTEPIVKKRRDRSKTQNRRMVVFKSGQ